ncbi:MAG: GDSL-type esterase/lipase family protein [Candidatus Symbiothrix sp.]|jgi:lysophospholipase L1-like esterase|nr:GDSL-type esterase/lipase family protein [Candidatus Symbiothrix sp.]
MKQVKFIFAAFLLLSTSFIYSCEQAKNSFLKVGVFGGSVSVYTESETAKNVWRDSLNITVESCGVSGGGFSSLTTNNVPMQIRQAKTFDIYILWCSTNDVATSTVGEVNSDDLSTQNGGLRKSIELIKQKNDKALILLFTSLPRFDQDIYYNRMQSFVDGQIAVCQANQIPYLDQWSLCGFDKNNFTPYYLDDKTHLTNAGYAHIAQMQMEFIRENIEKYWDTSAIIDTPVVASCLKIQYNPVTDNLVFEPNGANTQTIGVQIIDIAGQLIFSMNDFVLQRTVARTISVNGIAKGIYLLVAQTEEERLVKKFMKK